MLEGPAWAFVDWLMQECSGLEMCRRLRANPRTSEMHITILLEHDDLEDRRRALKAGADDYLVGEPTRSELLDRVLAAQSIGTSARPNQIIDFGLLKLDIAAQQARWDGEPIPLRPNELRLLRFMMENPDRVLSREDLISALGKEGDPDYLRTVDVWVKRLRSGFRKAGAPEMLRTVHGRGYVLDTPG